MPVEMVALAATHLDGDAVGDGGSPDVGPLLQLNDNGRVPGCWVLPGDQDVEALR